MKLGLFSILLTLSGLLQAQDNIDSTNAKVPLANEKTQKIKFNNDARQYNDWAVTVGGGTAILHHSDLTSINSDGNNFGWNAFIELNKQVSEDFGLILQYQRGSTKQTGRLKDTTYGLATATTDYNQVTLLGNINFTSMFRRIDNRSTYRWALIGYAGIGFQGYKFERFDEKPKTKLNDGTLLDESHGAFKQDFGIASFTMQGGIGFKHNLSRRIDLEARAMYIVTGDDEFDGGGETPESWPGYNLLVKNRSDNVMTFNVGVTFKLGKHDKHLAWNDAVYEMNKKMNNISYEKSHMKVCKSGDKDKDGVCDDWDRQIDTPFNARVDGTGVALDLDLDGVIDLNDKCITVAGTVENKGCPK